MRNGQLEALLMRGPSQRFAAGRVGQLQLTAPELPSITVEIRRELHVTTGARRIGAPHGLCHHVGVEVIPQLERVIAPTADERSVGAGIGQRGADP